jgi:hypothetical protein
MRKLTQDELILKMLRKAKSRGVRNYEFANHRILRYGARLETLRKDGYTILTEREYLKNGRATNVFVYTLVE